MGARGVGWATAREPRDQGTQWPQPAQPGGGAQSPPAGSQGLRAPQPIGPRRPGKEHGGGQAPRRQLAQLRRVPPGERGASLAHGLQPQGQKPRRSYPSLCPGLSGTPEPETGSPSDRLRPLADLFRSGAGAGESASVRRGAPPADRFPNGRETPGAQSGPLAPATQVAFSLGWPERREGPFSPAPRSDCRALRRVPPAHRTRRAGLMPSHPPRLTPQGEVGASTAPGRRIPAEPRTSTGPLLRVSSHNVCFLWVRQAGGRSWPPWSTQSTPVPPRRARTQGTISSVWTHPFPGPTSHTHTRTHTAAHTRTKCHPNASSQPRAGSLHRGPPMPVETTATSLLPTFPADTGPSAGAQRQQVGSTHLLRHWPGLLLSFPVLPFGRNCVWGFGGCFPVSLRYSLTVLLRLDFIHLIAIPSVHSVTLFSLPAVHFNMCTFLTCAVDNTRILSSTGNISSIYLFIHVQFQPFLFSAI